VNAAPDHLPAFPIQVKRMRRADGAATRFRGIMFGLKFQTAAAQYIQATPNVWQESSGVFRQL
jgi:hypothetical protein